VGRYYPDDYKELLKSKANILDVIAQFTPVRQAGHSYVAICPFHDDKDPSLLIKPTTNTFSCLACGAGSKNHSTVQSSDVYGFLKGVLKCNLSEAIEFLANFLHEPLPALDQEEQKKVMLRNAWVQHCEQAAQRFRDNLMNNKEAYSYLWHRGYDLHDILAWQLGYGDDKDYDFQNTKDRIAFPLFDYHGQMISFTGRVILPEHELKALNEERKSQGKAPVAKYQDRFPIPKDSPYYQNHPYPEFDKRNHLYGIHIAKTYIKDWGAAIVVEGWTDVHMLHKCGARHTVSTMGVVLTDAQMELIKRAGAKKVITMRDGDNAGMAAAERDARIIQAHGLIPMIVSLPAGMDPFDLCRKYIDNHDTEGLLRYIDKSMKTVQQWKIHKIYMETKEEMLYHYSQIAYYQNIRMQRVIETIAEVDSPVELDIYLRQAADLFQTDYDALKRQVMHYKSNKVHLVS